MILSIKNAVVFFCLFLFINVSAQYEMVWDKKIGGSGHDYMRGIYQNADGKLIMLGRSETSDGNIGPNYGGADAILFQFDDKGNIEWQQNYGGSADDGLGFGIEYKDRRGYLLIGSTSSNDYDLEGSMLSDSSTFWFLAIDLDGEIQWSKKWTLGHQEEALSKPIYYQDSLLLFSGQYLRSFDNQRVYYLMCMDEEINEIWRKEFLIPFDWSLGTAKIINDSTIVTTGSIQYGNTTAETKSILVEMNIEEQSINWFKEYGGDKEDRISGLIVEEDGNYILYGRTKSYAQNPIIAVNFDFWIFKTNKSGDVLWNRAYGSNSVEFLRYVEVFEDRILLVGSSFGKDLDVTGNYGLSDIWIVETDKYGHIISEKNYGGSRGDGIPWNVITSCDGRELFFATETDSEDFDVSPGPIGGIYNYDIWIAKLRKPEAFQPAAKCDGLVYPNPINTSEPIYIRTKGQNEETVKELNLYDVAGRLIKTKNSIGYTFHCEEETLEININNSSLSSGIYILNVKDIEKECSYKVFINE